jgi:flagellin
MLMALSIHTNYSSLVTQTNLGKTNNALSTNQQRLGTGLRINSAADDAAGLQIATRLDAQSRGMGVATRNISDATSLLQTAEGAFSEMTDIVQRMKDLATQAANGTNSADDLTALNSEYAELGKEINNIFDNTKFAGKELLKKGAGSLEGDIKFQIGASAGEVLTVNIGTALKKLTTAGDLVNGIAINLTATSSATAGPQGGITTLEKALNDIGSVRASLGANINRLAHTANNLANMKDNTDVAKGNILDADFAKESASMTKNSMLLQSGISMLKQAGQMPSMVMSLLG